MEQPVHPEGPARQMQDAASSTLCQQLPWRLGVVAPNWQGCSWPGCCARCALRVSRIHSRQSWNHESDLVVTGEPIV